MLTAVVGTNWGDEGKGRMVDLLAGQNDIVVRYQGGNNAGHTVVNNKGKFVLNLLPSGILRESTVNVMGNGMVIDIEHLVGEITALQARGISITQENLKISDKATICLPFHKMLDEIEEDRLGAAKQGSTRRGIAPVYADRYMRKSIRMADLLSPDTLEEKIISLTEWKNLTIVGGYEKEAVCVKDTLNWLLHYGKILEPYICSTTYYLAEALQENKNVLFEAQLGALRDIDFGIYPYTSSSSTLAAYAPIGAGIPFARIDEILGITKAYSSSVGGGPFVVELSGAEAEKLRKEGNEYGAATGRPRRVGPFDVVATKYGVLMQGATHLALTNLDVISYMDEIPVCIAYEIDDEKTTSFPTGDLLERAKPVVTYLPGFREDISKCRALKDLPAAAQAYVRYIEEAVGVPIKYISVGPERNDYMEVK
ncbi:MAG: adenylosuccinate synthase [Christensenellaceae bacterium]|jgi:adenylosuccinate synthase